MAIFRTTAFAATLIFAAASAFAQDAQDRSAHHPNAATGAQPQAAEPVAPQAGMMGSDMMGGTMMRQGPTSSGDMMSMMRMMSTRSGAGHIEGRLAFIKAELKIGDAQTAQWNAFSDAVRGNAKSMSEMRQAMMSREDAPATLPERLALEDKAVTAHLAALRKTEESLDTLYGVLSRDQKKVADSIIVDPMGMPMGML